MGNLLRVQRGNQRVSPASNLVFHFFSGQTGLKKETSNVDNLRPRNQRDFETAVISGGICTRTGEIHLQDICGLRTEGSFSDLRCGAKPNKRGTTSILNSRCRQPLIPALWRRQHFVTGGAIITRQSGCLAVVIEMGERL